MHFLAPEYLLCTIVLVLWNMSKCVKHSYPRCMFLLFAFRASAPRAQNTSNHGTKLVVPLLICPPCWNRLDKADKWCRVMLIQVEFRPYSACCCCCCCQDSDMEKSRYGLHPSLLKPPLAETRNELIAWDFLNARTISSPRHKNPKRALETSLRLGLMDTVRQVCLTRNFRYHFLPTGFSYFFVFHVILVFLLSLSQTILCSRHNGNCWWTLDDVDEQPEQSLVAQNLLKCHWPWF